MKLGKQPFRYDKRTALVRDFLDETLTPPSNFDYDKHRAPFPWRMWGNDNLGDCVLADQMNQLLRLERAETRHTLLTSDQDVISTYLAMTGGQDTGLVMLDTYNWWRNQGWSVHGKNYKIDGFGQLHPDDGRQLRLACYLLHGVSFGFALPLTAQQGTNEGVWDVVSGPGAEPGSWGGHAVYAKRFDRENFYVITWGREVRVTNAFIAAYCDEAWAVVDSLDVWRKHPAFDVQKFEQYLSDIGATRY
jgi:hypothetical protein